MAYHVLPGGAQQVLNWIAMIMINKRFQVQPERHDLDLQWRLLAGPPDPEQLFAAAPQDVSCGR